MSKPVLFVTGLGKDKARAENMMELYQAYPGEKVYISGHDPNATSIITSGKYDLMVIDVFPTVKPKKAIMIWHAIQGGKYIGLDQKGTYYRPEMAKLMDYIIVAGRGGIDMFERCTGVDRDRIMPLGMPRTDRYFRETKQDPVPGLEDKVVYMFTPTFRSASDPPMPEINWHEIDGQLTDGEIFLVKAHPYGREFNIGNCRHIRQVNTMEPTYKYLLAADVVITDYSSIIFDASLLGKPTVLFEKVKGYALRRGMYLHYPWQYSSRYATNEKELLFEVRMADGLLTSAERDSVNYVAGMCDGYSCKRISRFIMEVNNNEESRPTVYDPGNDGQAGPKAEGTGRRRQRVVVYLSGMPWRRRSR